MASDFEKPNKIHTLFQNEIKSKMWNMDVSELFMVGKATTPKLKNLNINTIGDLAKYDEGILNRKFKKYGKVLRDYANGIDNAPVNNNYEKAKGIGNSITLPRDIDSKEEALLILRQLSKKVVKRLKESNNLCKTVVVDRKSVV